ncbi:hypothetical protein O6H91_13G099300 [Diphasiastrum complanatum]|uniref:Uncharacterized protein n=4 Tax=Diphasiastrum complanatum TaxID=34168 RepID=A0ACC2BXR4_DIPCM|nr:hypothetical protein O6H91_13G097900 [Diphasiastrum complanatum]KAJ7534523.1 hypothetical protein O6H91_13G097900 [Diphasiastrum complanatum]KAJ7534554.1 hypothetical protein O6H91_13G099300 [Diphasiastrum complanatum]KAJ7534555.1 hypothetical protein O6H91_13G099300 [Diphasiastrum complanatum]
METSGGVISETPSDEKGHNNIPYAAVVSSKPSSSPVNDSLETFLQNFFSQHMLDEASQRSIREKLGSNLIHSSYSLSRSAPTTLILAGLPAVFVDECTRAGLFHPEATSTRLQMEAAGPKPTTWSPVPKWASLDGGNHPSQTIVHRTPHNNHRGVNWSLHEIIVLLDAKKRDDAACTPGRGSKKVRSSDDRWTTIAQYCQANDVHKSAQQCMNKWEKLNTSFRKVFDYQRHFHSTHESYWNLSRERREDKALPISFNRDVYKAMTDRFLYDRINPEGEEEDQLNDSEDDLVSMSSEEKTAGRKRKLEPKSPGFKKDIVDDTKQLIESFERIEQKKLQVERHRIACDEKGSASICKSIAEIASSIRSIAEAIQSMS